MSKAHQWEMPVIGSVFNLALVDGEDPFRVERERWAAEQAKVDAREYQRRMQRSFEACPGFVGADAPAGPQCTGRVVVEPGKVSEAREWLKKRFHVSDSIELSAGDGLVFEVAPRVRRVTQGQKPVKVRFGKPEQYTLSLQ